MITQAELKERLHYDPETGVFTWLKTSDWRFVGQQTGHIKMKGKSPGYVEIMISKKGYMAHRLAWFYVYGEFPKGGLDHINRDKADNRIANLREATTLQNARNIDIAAHNNSGFKGVSWHHASRKWRADIAMLGRNLYLGTFQTPEEASAQYERFASAIHGEFYYNRIATCQP